jgi:hypothetical protein
MNGIELLEKQASVSSAPSAARLKGAAQMDVQWCSQKYRVQYETAARSEGTSPLKPNSGLE